MYEVGQEIYYTGDMANRDGWGKITKVEPCEWYKYKYTLEMADGRVKHLTPYVIGEVYEGHAGTRFVTLEAYKAYKKKVWAQYEKESA